MEAGSLLSPGELDLGASEERRGGDAVALRGGGGGRLPVLFDLQACLQDQTGPRHGPSLQHGIEINKDNTPLLTIKNCLFNSISFATLP